MTANMSGVRVGVRVGGGGEGGWVGVRWVWVRMRMGGWLCAHIAGLLVNLMVACPMLCI